MHQKVGASKGHTLSTIFLLHLLPFSIVSEMHSLNTIPIRREPAFFSRIHPSNMTRWLAWGVRIAAR